MIRSKHSSNGTSLATVERAATVWSLRNQLENVGNLFSESLRIAISDHVKEVELPVEVS